jgi:hypothetical protein
MLPLIQDEGREAAERRAVARTEAKKLHFNEKENFDLEMQVMGEHMDEELDEFEDLEITFEAAIKVRGAAC